MEYQSFEAKSDRPLWYARISGNYKVANKEIDYSEITIRIVEFLHIFGLSVPSTKCEISDKLIFYSPLIKQHQQMPSLITNPEEIALNERQEALQFIGRPPSLFLRFGITAIASVVLLLLTMSYFIKYPDVVVAKVVLTTENPPIRLLSKTGGRVAEILVKNNQTISKGDILCVMENTANWQDVLKLETQLSPLPQRGEFELAKLPPLGGGGTLGSLQNSYSTFTQNLKDYHYFLEKNGVLQKIQYINQQIESLKALNTNLLKQKDIQRQEFGLAEKELSRQKQLNTEGVISDTDFEKNNAQYLQQKRQIEANEAAFINNEMQIGQLQSQINDLSQSKNDNQNTKGLTIQEDIRRLKATIEEWKQTFLIIAPISGKVTFAKIWSNQQSITAGEEVLTIVPSLPQSPQDGEVANAVICKAILPIAQSGKVKTGLIANIRLDAFPYQQYGILRGSVKNISLVPQKEDYQLDIAIPNALVTSYEKTLPFRQELQGSANIITEDRRVVERFLDKFRDLMKNRE
jgi:multidrug resistance efflux pump